MSLFFGSFTKALLSVFEFPTHDNFAYKLDLPVTGEADELSLVLLSGQPHEKEEEICYH